MLWDRELLRSADEPPSVPGAGLPRLPAGVLLGRMDSTPDSGNAIQMSSDGHLRATETKSNLRRRNDGSDVNEEIHCEERSKLLNPRKMKHLLHFLT